MKRGPMSQSDKDFIVKNKKKTLKFLSKQIGRSEDSIKEFLDSLSQQEEESSTPPVVKTDTPLSNSFARNKKYGAVVMTPTASMISDEKRLSRKTSSAPKNHIFIMNPEKQ